MKITKLQLDTIVKNAPDGIDAQYIQEGLIERGYEIEGVDTMAAKAFIAQKKAGIVHPADMPQQEDQLIEPVVPKQNTGLLKSVKNFGNSIGDALYAGKASKMAEENQQQHDEYLQKLTNRQKEMKLAGQDTSRIEAVMKNMLQDDPQNYGADVATIIPSINKNTKQIVGEGLGVLTDLLVTTGGLGAVAGGGAMMGTSAMQDNKSAGKIATDTAIGMIGGKILEVGFNKVSPYVEKVVATYGTPLLEKLTQYIPESAMPKLQELAQKATIGSGTGGTDVLNKVNALAEAPLNMATDAVGGVVGKARVAAAKPNVPDSLEMSVDRLKSSKLSKESPVDTYNKYVNQEKKLKVNAKETDALGLIGTEDLGPAIDDVIKLRREAGATMGAEMKKVGSTKVSLAEQFPAFEKSLADNGVMMKGKKFVGSPTSKLTDQDIKLINDYVVKLNKLGANPTAAELDAFVSKISQDLDVYASKGGIMKTTNGMRMIQQNLREMSTQLSPKTNSAFKGYAEAKAKYADLSSFLKDNQTLFGKKTASGDYIKDVSTLKSAIKSTLGGNKKDFLLKLEELTGRPIVDKTVIALQAMKDMGNAQGDSLLNILMSKDPSIIPTSPEGIIGKGVSMVAKQAKKAFVGTPEEQTRRVIQSRLGSESKVVAPLKKPQKTH